MVGHLGTRRWQNGEEIVFVPTVVTQGHRESSGTMKTSCHQMIWGSLKQLIYERLPTHLSILFALFKHQSNCFARTY